VVVVVVVVVVDVVVVGVVVVVIVDTVPLLSVAVQVPDWPGPPTLLDHVPDIVSLPDTVPLNVAT
jgi:hypothetical protein